MRGLVICLLLASILLVANVSAQQSGSIKLLAVNSNGNETVGGSVADLSLEIRPGSGRVFLDTYPFTKLDTQISTRFANQVACSYFELDCESYDFIYTLTARSSIIGGPSAGAAMGALTAMVVEGLPIDESVAITGTLNSGGIVGPVGGYPEKVEAAGVEGLSKVLVSKGAIIQQEENETIDLTLIGADAGVSVVEVNDLDDVVEAFTGTRLLEPSPSIVISDEYTSIMQDVAGQLCERFDTLSSLVDYNELNESQVGRLQNLSDSLAIALDEQNYYSAASFCFGSNIALRNIHLPSELEEDELGERVFFLRKQISNFTEYLEELDIDSLNELQTYAIVSERLKDAQETLDNGGGDYYSAIAYAEERLFSAIVWAEFFRLSDKPLNIDQRILRNSCEQKIQEANELYQYVNLYVPFFTQGILANIDVAEELAMQGDYALCLMRASEAKADAASILTTVSADQEDLPILIDQKLGAVERSIGRTQEDGGFPILAYSYYEYAQTLRNQTPGSALLYAEYALELSNLDIYFEDEPVPTPRPSPLSREVIIAFIGGLVMGILLTAALVLLKKPSDAAPKRNIRGKKR